LASHPTIITGKDSRETGAGLAPNQNIKNNPMQSSTAVAGKDASSDAEIFDTSGKSAAQIHPRAHDRVLDIGKGRRLVWLQVQSLPIARLTRNSPTLSIRKMAVLKCKNADRGQSNDGYSEQSSLERKCEGGGAAKGDRGLAGRRKKGSARTAQG